MIRWWKEARAKACEVWRQHLVLCRAEQYDMSEWGGEKTFRYQALDFHCACVELKIAIFGGEV